MIGIIVYVVHTQQDEEGGCLDDLSHIIKPNSTLYKSINELESPYRQQYINSLKTTFSPKASLSKRYIQSTGIALLAGTMSEYIVSGNIDKPMGIIGKTIMFNLIFLTITDS